MIAETVTSGLSDMVIAALSAGGFAAIVTAFITGLFSRKKLGAEATEIITKAAAGVVSSLEDEVRRQQESRRADQAEHTKIIEDMASAHVKERREWQRVLQLHVAWDAIAIAKLSEFGVTDLPEAPPLLPARRYVDESGHPIH